MKVVFPGSFDPITNGHEDIILRLLKLFKSVDIVILNNFNKNHLFSISERRDVILKIFENQLGVSVNSYDGLLSDYIRDNDVDLIVRGIRNTVDYENEKINFKVNKDLCGIETLFLLSENNSDYLSSSMIKDVYFNNGDISLYVNDIVLEMLNNKFRRNK